MRRKYVTHTFCHLNFSMITSRSDTKRFCDGFVKPLSVYEELDLTVISLIHIIKDRKNNGQ